jgi:homocysteine S-methyltransferase
MHDPLAPLLHEFGFIVLDGGLATELERRGANLDDPLWSAKVLLEAPALIRAVHHDYFRAGADVATSASYQATFAGFAARGIDRPHAAELMRLSVRLAQEARTAAASHRSEALLVAASVGCYGAALHDGSEYRGDYGRTAQQLIDFHRPRLEVLAESGPDLLACETIPCQIEAEALLRALESVPTPAWLSFSCRDTKHVWHGETLRACLALAEGVPQVVAVGINCTAPHLVAGLLEEIAGRTSKPILVYPNSGEQWNAATRGWSTSDNTLTDWAAAARAWVALGAAGIGGCCRTTPNTIRDIRRGLMNQ